MGESAVRGSGFGQFARRYAVSVPSPGGRRGVRLGVCSRGAMSEPRGGQRRQEDDSLTSAHVVARALLRRPQCAHAR